MANSAPQIQYRQEYVDAFEYRVSKFRVGATKEMVIKGNSAVFNVAGSGNRSAVTRGLNGLIPASEPSFSQNTCSLVEYHDLPQMTGFNVFQSQGDARRTLIDSSVAVLNRQCDDVIIAALSTGTVNTGAAQQAHLGMFTKAKGILGRSDVDVDQEDSMFCALTPAAEAYLLSVKEFTSADYADVKPFAGGAAVKMRRWMGVNFFVSSRLSGVGTAAEKVLMWHRNAIGFAFDKETINPMAGYNEEQDYHWARTSMFMAGKLLQNSGVVIINHDGSAI
jgi:hypothetical protein